MAYGDGSIVKVKNGVWKVRVDFGRDPITKKRIIVSRNVKGTKADARKKRDEIKAEHESGLVTGGNEITFAEFAEQWQSGREKAGEVGKTRLKRERGMIACMNGYIGTAMLKELTPQVIDNLFTKMRSDKIEELGSISGTTMNMYHKLLKQILGQAVNFDLILRNPLDKIKAPKRDTAERRSLSTEEVRTLLTKIDEAEESAYAELDAKQRRPNNEPSRLQGLSKVGNVIGARIALATGMRRGEIIGLTWGCVDFKNSRIRVTQSVTVLGELKAPKSEAGKRIINVDPVTMAHLVKWQYRQESELEKICLEQDASTPVVCSDTGDFMNANNFSRWWRTFAANSGFEGWHLHELRHTQASQLVALGADIKTVQHRLGHASAALTMNLYAHALPENDIRAAEMIGSLFSDDSEERTPGSELKQAG